MKTRTIMGPTIRTIMGPQMSLKTQSLFPQLIVSFLGSGPDRGSSLVERGDCPSVCFFVRPFRAIPRGLWPGQLDLRTSQPGLRPNQQGIRPGQYGLGPSQPTRAEAQAWLGPGWMPDWLGLRTSGLGFRPVWMALKGDG